MFDNKLQTFYSYNYSQFAEGKPNQTIAIGNKLTLGRFGAYLDLATSNYGVEHFNIASPAINAYRMMGQPTASGVLAENLNFKNAIIRADYEFVPRWFITAKGIWESASHRTDAALGTNFRTNAAYLAGLEYQPIKSQDMRLFAYYYTDEITYKNAIAAANANTKQNLFAVGLFYFINAF